MFRLRFDDGAELVLTEAGKKKRAGVWLLRPDALAADLAHLGPEADELDPATLAGILASDSRRLHSLLRDQRLIAGIGRAWANEILLAAKLSPYALSTQLGAEETERLATAIHDELDARARAPPRRRVERRDLPRPRPARRAVLALPDADRDGRLRGAHDLLLPDLPDRGARPQGPADVEAAAMKIERAVEATEELHEAIRKLLPQLTEARRPPTLEQLAEVVATQTVLVARDDEAAGSSARRR